MNENISLRKRTINVKPISRNMPLETNVNGTKILLDLEWKIVPRAIQDTVTARGENAKKEQE